MKTKLAMSYAHFHCYIQYIHDIKSICVIFLLLKKAISLYKRTAHYTSRSVDTCICILILSAGFRIKRLFHR